MIAAQMYNLAGLFPSFVYECFDITQLRRMNMYLRKKSIFCASTLAAAILAAQAFAATNFTQTNLVADVAGVAAVTDPNLVGTWGISESSGRPALFGCLTPRAEPQRSIP
jgi:hypothetical protein